MAQDTPVADRPKSEDAAAPSGAAGGVWDLRADGVKGRLTEAHRKRLSGWIYRPRAAQDRLRIVLLCDGEPAAAMTAALPYPGLSEKGRGDGAYGFEFRTPAVLLDGAPHRLDLRLEGAADSLLDARLDVQLVQEEGSKPWLRVLSQDPPRKAARRAAASAPYLDSPEDIARLGEAAWEHLALEGEQRTAALERFAGALRLERTLCAGVLGHDPKGLLVVLAPTEADAVGAAESMRAWTLQSHPDTDSLVLAGSGASIDFDPAVHAGMTQAAWCVFARAGDAIHPSTTALLDRQAASADVVMWSLLVPDRFSGSDGVVHRRPAYDPHTVRHNPSLDTTFAVRGEALADCPAAVLEALWDGHVHPLLFWLTTQSALRWRVWPQTLTSRPDTGALDSFAARAAVEANLDLYRELARPLAGVFDLRESRTDLPVPFALAPSVRPQTISVVLRIEAGEDHRALRSLFQLACQRTTAVVEVVLVGPGAAAHAAAAQRMFGHDRVHVLRPNHAGVSQQLNAAAAAATGEALVFLGLDVKAAEDETILEELAAWALQPGVGAVGCGLAAPGPAGRTSFGMTGAPASLNLYAPVLIPDEDPAYAGTIHACAGASLSFAAIRRQAFLAVGGMDAARFPDAQHEAEFMLRCARSGLVHLYLGHLRAEFDTDAPDAGAGDPTALAQLRQLYPEAIQAGLFTLGRQALASGAVEAAGAPYSAQDLEQLAAAAALRADLDDEVRRGILSEVAKVAEASGTLLAALERLQAMTSSLS